MNFIEVLKQNELYKTSYGVYCIKHISSNRIYVGSTTVSFFKRLSTHYFMLISNSHDNQYLQNTWNKYGESEFSIDILYVCSNKQEVLKKEQEFLDLYECCNPRKGFNINPIAAETPKLTKEQLEKRANTLRNYSKIRYNKYQKWKNGELSESELSDKEKQHFIKISTTIPWNKGSKASDELKKKLSDSAKNRKCTEEGKLKRRQKCRIKLPNIYVYDIKLNYIGMWNSSSDLEEDSNNNNFILKSYMILRNKEGRNGYSPYFLSSFNINKSCKKGIIYKGLYFKYEPLHQEIDVEKMEEFDESPSKQKDNVEPSIVNESKSNNKGVETND
jgi:group I intron endonuclease